MFFGFSASSDDDEKESEKTFGRQKCRTNFSELVGREVLFSSFRSSLVVRTWFFGFSASSDDDEKITEIVRGTIAEDKNIFLLSSI